MTPDGVQVRSSGSSFRLDVQGLRGIAVIAVVLYHAGDLLPGGFVGVDVFFVISGFVIARSLIREHARDGRISIRSFYRRRVLRLTPALALMLAVVLLLNPFLGPFEPQAKTVETGLGAALLAANVTLVRGDGYFSEAAELNPLLHTWSLSLEEQFYLVFPVLVLLLLRRGRGWMRWGLTLASVLSVAVMFVFLWTLIPALPAVPSERLAFFAMPSRAWQFGAGALVATWPVVTGRRAAVLGAVGAALTLGAVLLLDDAVYPDWTAFVPTLGAAALVASADGPVARALTWRPLVRVGDVSYSYYLWHWPLMVWAIGLGVDSRVALAAVGLAAYPLAAASYERVEQRYRSARTDRKRVRRARPAPVVFAAATVVVIGAVAVNVASFAAIRSQERFAHVAAAAQEHADESCRVERVADGLRGCHLADGDGLRVALVGDSNAGQYSTTLERQAATRDWDLWSFKDNSCPPVVGVVLVEDGSADTDCQRHNDRTVSHLADGGYDVVVLAGASEEQADEHGSAYASGLRGYVDRVTDAGIGVVIVHPIPKLGDDTVIGANRCSAVARSLRGSSCTTTRTIRSAASLRADAVRIEADVADDSGAEVLDPFPMLCTSDPCSEVVEGIAAYRDSGHLSRNGAELVGPSLADAVLAAARPGPRG